MCIERGGELVSDRLQVNQAVLDTRSHVAILSYAKWLTGYFSRSGARHNTDPSLPLSDNYAQPATQGGICCPVRIHHCPIVEWLRCCISVYTSGLPHLLFVNYKVTSQSRYKKQLELWMAASLIRTHAVIISSDIPTREEKCV